MYTCVNFHLRLFLIAPDIHRCLPSPSDPRRVGTTRSLQTPPHSILSTRTDKTWRSSVHTCETVPAVCHLSRQRLPLSIVWQQTNTFESVSRVFPSTRPSPSSSSSTKIQRHKINKQVNTNGMYTCVNLHLRLFLIAPDIRRCLPSPSDLRPVAPTRS